MRYHDNFFKKDEIWIIMEYCSQGSLTDMLTQRKKVFTEPLIACVADAVLRGLKYLHNQKKIHRDVKPQNVLVGDAGVPKLADFGIAGQLGGDRTRTDTMIGTPYYLAPEIIVNEHGYNERVDVWALGISLIQLAEMAPPHADVNPMRALLLITTSDAPALKEPAKWSPRFSAFLKKALVKEPLDRPPAADLLSHPFVTDNPEPDAMRDYVAMLLASSNAAPTRMSSGRTSASAPPPLPAAAAAAPAADEGSSGSRSKTPRSHKHDGGGEHKKKSGKSSGKSSSSSSKRSPRMPEADDDQPPLRLERAVTEVNRVGAVPMSRQLSQPAAAAAQRPADERPAVPAVPPPLSVQSGMPVCVACGETIDGKHMVVGESRWHKEHFRCSVCDELLSKDGFVYKEGVLFCRFHYHQRYSPMCGGCGQRITAGGYASALGQAWHPEHLVCAACRQPFKSGRFIAKGNKPFCDKECHADYVKLHGSAAAAGTTQAITSPKLTSKGSGSTPVLSSRGSGSALASSADTSATSSPKAKRQSGLVASASMVTAAGGGGGGAAAPEAAFSEHLNRFAFFKKFYLEICTEASTLPDATFVAYVDSCIALRRKVGVLRLSGDVTQQPWTPASLALVARAVVRASTFGAPQGVNFTENMAISTIDLSNAELGAEHVDALVTLLNCSFPLRELVFANNTGLGKRALVDLTDALCRRKSLQRLDLANCGVVDKVLQHVLAELVKVKTDFQVLDLSNNQLSPAAGQFVGEFVSSCGALHELRLSGNKFGDKGVVDLVKQLQMPQHTALRVLTLANTGLKRGVELAQWINDNAKHRSSLADCLFLAELDVSNNALDTDFAHFAGQLIATPACPATLNLATNKFNAKASKLLVDGLASPKSAARDLALGGCDMTDAAMAVLCDALRPGGGTPTPPLVRLSLRDCSISSAGLSLLAKALKAGGKLVELDIAFNKIAADAATELASAIVNGNVLDELNVAACHLNKASLGPFCKLVRHSASLTKLHVDANDWNAAMLQELATALEFNTRLELLTLRNISVGVKDLVDFVASLSDSITLRKLNLEQNGLEKAPAAFAERLAKFKHLSVLWK